MRPSEIAQSVIDTVGRPVSNSSLFYSTYYLSEIQDVDEASFDLFRLSNEMYDGIYYYGLLTVAKEAINKNALKVREGGGTSKTLGHLDYEELDRRILPFIDSKYRGFAKKMFIDAREMNLGIDILVPEVDNMVESIKFADKEYGVFSNTDQLLNTCEQIFNIEERSEGKVYWADEFGGPSWVGVIEHIRQRDEMTKIMWVDQSLSIEHNTRQWFNKIEPIKGERITLYDELSESEKRELLDKKQLEQVGEVSPETGRETKLEDFFDTARSTVKLRPYQTYDLLNKLLDKNFNGEMDYVFRFASLFDEQVDVSIRRYRRML